MTHDQLLATKALRMFHAPLDSDRFMKIAVLHIVRVLLKVKQELVAERQLTRQQIHDNVRAKVAIIAAKIYVQDLGVSADDLYALCFGVWTGEFTAADADGRSRIGEAALVLSIDWLLSENSAVELSNLRQDIGTSLEELKNKVPEAEGLNINDASKFVSMLIFKAALVSGLGLNRLGKKR